jgi:HD superfamily phosphohydrolase YqeK
MDNIRNLLPDPVASKYLPFAEKYIKNRRGHIENMLLLSGRLIEKYSELGKVKNDFYTTILLHDCGKELPRSRQKKLAATYQGKLDDLEKRIPALWHASAGAQLIKKELNITENEITHAVAFHPTGDANMTLLLQGLMIADYAEGGRGFPGAKKIRNQIGSVSLAELTLSTLIEKITHCLQNKKLLHHRSLEAYNSLCV